MSAQVGQGSPAARPERGPCAEGRGSGLPWCFLSASQLSGPRPAPLEGLGDRRKGLAAAVWLGGGSFLCRRKLLPLQALGVAELCCGASCCSLSRDTRCWGEERVWGSRVFILDATCCQVSGILPCQALLEPLLPPALNILDQNSPLPWAAM